MTITLDIAVSNLNMLLKQAMCNDIVTNTFHETFNRQAADEIFSVELGSRTKRYLQLNIIIPSI